MPLKVMDLQASMNDVAATARAHAARNDKEGRFPQEALRALADNGLMGLTVDEAHGGLGQGPGALAVLLPLLAEADASAAMVYMMHLCGTACVQAAPPGPRRDEVLSGIAAGQHLTTLAFSERGSRSHFWAPVSQATANGEGVILDAEKSFVTSADHADSYVVTTRSLDAEGPTDATLYLVDQDATGVEVGDAWDGLGLRGNDSAPVRLRGVHVGRDQRLTDEGGGFDAKVGVVLPVFDLASACVSLGICRAALAATTAHLAGSELEHIGAGLGESLPTLRAGLARMGVATDALADYVTATAASLEAPDETTQARVLQVKALGNETALEVTATAMRMCGGAAFAGHVPVERCFRDAQAGAVMAPTADVLYELLGRARLGMPLFG